MIYDKLNAAIDDLFETSDFKAREKYFRQLSDITGVSVASIRSQNRQRGKLYIDNLTRAIRQKLSTPPPKLYPGVEALHNFEFTKNHREKMTGYSQIEWRERANHKYSFLLNDALTAPKYINEIRPLFRRVGDAPKQLLNSFELEQTMANRNTLEVQNKNIRSNVIWKGRGDKQGSRKPKCLIYHVLINYGLNHELTLLFNLYHLDFTLSLIYGGPSPRYTSFSEGECEEMEFIKMFIEMKLFSQLTSILDEYFLEQGIVNVLSTQN